MLLLCCYSVIIQDAYIKIHQHGQTWIFDDGFSRSQHAGPKGPTVPRFGAPKHGGAPRRSAWEEAMNSEEVETLMGFPHL